MKLSVIVPSIRPQKLWNLYKSIDITDFEMIAIGPFNSDEGGSFRFIESWRSPCACQQQALLEATGDYIVFGADDGVFLPGALDEAVNMIDDDKTVVISRYLEGDIPHLDMAKECYYKLHYHKPFRLKGVPDTFIFTNGPISRKFLLELGGFDAEHFDTPAMAHADLGIRAYKAGAKFILGPLLMKVGHQPGRSGDHAPMHNAQIHHDQPVFKKIYSKPNDRIMIPLDNWKNTEEKWSRRFR